MGPGEADGAVDALEEGEGEERAGHGCYGVCDQRGESVGEGREDGEDVDVAVGLGEGVGVDLDGLWFRL